MRLITNADCLLMNIHVVFGYFNGAMPTISNQITPWRKVLLEKLTVADIVKKFAPFYGTPVFTKTTHWTISRATRIHSTSSHPISFKFISVGIATMLRSGRSGFDSRGLGGWEFFSSPQCPERLYAHSASYPMGTRGSFPGGKAAGAWRSPHTSI
jgi:hypothetical protein